MDVREWLPILIVALAILVAAVRAGAARPQVPPWAKAALRAVSLAVIGYVIAQFWR